MKFTFELSQAAAEQAAIKAGAAQSELQSTAQGIVRASIIKLNVKDSEQYRVLADQQAAGYIITSVN